MNSSTQLGNRQIYQNSVASMMAAFKASGYSDSVAQQMVNQAVLSQGYIRLEQTLTVTNSTFTFPVLVNDQNGQGQGARATEKRLTLQDAFYVGGVMMFISKVATATSTNMLMDTYPNPITYPLSFAAGTPAGASALETLYAGSMRITVNNNVIIPGFDLLKFRQAPQTQLTGATNSPITQFDGTAMEFMEPNPVFIGSKNTQISINLPSAIGTLEATPVIVTLLFRGILAQNVTVVS